jgi:hypothetical protein
MLVMLAVAAIGACSESGTPAQPTPDDGDTTEISTSTSLPGLQAEVAVVDRDSISLTLVNSGPEVRIGAVSHFTASVESARPRYFQLRIVAPSGWDEVEYLGVISQVEAGKMPNGDQAVLPVDLPPGIGPGPHLLRVGYSVVSGDQGGMEDVLFTLPDDGP